MTRTPAVLVAVALAAAAGCASAGTAAQDSTQGGAAPAPGPYLYVTNQNAASVAVIDRDELAVVARVDLQAIGFGPNARPHDVAVEPDGSFWYVTLIGENRVLKLDRENRLVGQVETEVPGLAIVHPTRDLLLVARSMTAVNPPSSVALIRRSDMTLLDEIDVLFPRPHGLAIRPQGDRAYSASLAENRIAVIDPGSGDVRLIDVPGPEPAAHAAHADSAAGHAMAAHTLVEFAMAPDGRTMVTGGELSGDLLVFDLADPDAPRLIRTIPLGGSPWHPAFTPDGGAVWVPLHRANAVAVVDASSWEVVDRIEGRGLAQPHQVVPAPDGTVVFVSNNNTSGEYVPDGDEPKAGTVVVIDPRTRTILKVLEVGPNATGMDTARPPRP